MLLVVRDATLSAANAVPSCAVVVVRVEVGTLSALPIRAVVLRKEYPWLPSATSFPPMLPMRAPAVIAAMDAGFGASLTVSAFPTNPSLTLQPRLRMRKAW